jgi:ribosome-binding ATPase YchF (GTP1/OBG family)
MGFPAVLSDSPIQASQTFLTPSHLCVFQPNPILFCTIEPNVGVVPVLGSPLSDLAHLVKPEKATATTIQFIDIAGLMDTHKGEGLGNEFLGWIGKPTLLAT